jgi:hypothetical protein
LWNVRRDDGGVRNLRSVSVDVADAVVDVAVVVVVVGIVVDINDVVIVVVVGGVVNVNDVVIGVGVGVGVVVVVDSDGVLCVDARGWCNARCIGKEQTEVAGARSVSGNEVSHAVLCRKVVVVARMGELHRVVIGFEREGIVNPVFRIFVFIFALNGCVP